MLCIWPAQTMNSQNPFVPGAPAPNPTRLRTVILLTLGSQAFIIFLLLLQGWRP